MKTRSLLTLSIACGRAAIVLSLCLIPCRAADSAASDPAPLLELRTRTARFSISGQGAFTALASADGTHNYLAAGQPAPVLSLRVGQKLYRPARASWDAPAKRLTLDYPDAGAKAVLQIQEKPSHLAFTIAEVQPVDRVELALWGPYPTTIGEIIGDTVGVVRNAGFAIGLQALNIKTLGGYPEQENDVEQGRGGEDHGQYADLPPELNQGQSYRGDTARAAAFGSVLQAFCRNRDHTRVIPNWSHNQFVAPALADGGVIGSSIALFAVPAASALSTLGEIELAEGLPHPMIDGVWGKISPTATASYLIVDFSESTIDRAIDMARRAGLNYIYHSSPFETWGHFQLKAKAFPHGWDGLRACVDRARQAGIRVGFHTLSNFITPNDPYVTPTPDPRLARVGAAPLAADLAPDAREIPVAAPDFFTRQTDLNTVVIGTELIRYRAVTTNAPWRLLECERGAWGTAAAPHHRDDPVAKLADHGYKVFLTDPALSQEVARNIAALFNQTGCLQLSFDGLEGNFSTGLGQYGTTLFPKAWFDALSPELRGRVINDASMPGHFNWHINTRMNWGEPWYAGFRESQTLYRFKNQVYFERNFLPRMLGWFALRADTSVEDIEWMLARAAGYHAGFGLATSLASTAQLTADPDSADTLQKFGAMPSILQAIQQWETARIAGAFPPEVRTALRDNLKEFHLAPAGPGQWDLAEITVTRFTNNLASNPSSSAEFHFNDPTPAAGAHWIMRSSGTNSAEQISIELNGVPLLPALAALPARQSLKYTGGAEAWLYDSQWKRLASVPVNAKALDLPSGSRTLKLTSSGAPVALEWRSVHPPVRVARRSGSGQTD